MTASFFRSTLSIVFDDESPSWISLPKFNATFQLLLQVTKSALYGLFFFLLKTTGDLIVKFTLGPIADVFPFRILGTSQPWRGSSFQPDLPQTGWVCFAPTIRVSCWHGQYWHCGEDQYWNPHIAQWHRDTRDTRDTGTSVIKGFLWQAFYILATFDGRNSIGAMAVNVCRMPSRCPFLRQHVRARQLQWWFFRTWYVDDIFINKKSHTKVVVS